MASTAVCGFLINVLEKIILEEIYVFHTYV
jgi:hypothetical protein